MRQKAAKRRKRLVCENSSWVCFAPFVSVWPYQIQFYPKRHVCDISQMSDRELRDMADIIRKVFCGISDLFVELPYNMMYHNFPNSDFWHFYINVFPRLITHAGFEFFGLNVDIVAPETVAKDLRKVVNKRKNE